MGRSDGRHEAWAIRHVPSAACIVSVVGVRRVEDLSRVWRGIHLGRGVKGRGWVVHRRLVCWAGLNERRGREQGENVGQGGVHERRSRGGWVERVGAGEEKLFDDVYMGSLDGNDQRSRSGMI